MKFKNIKTITVLGTWVLLMSHAQAQSQFDFSLTGNPSVSLNGSDLGTIYGLITLNASQTAATSVILTSVPATVGTSDPLNYNFAASPEVFYNQFGVTGGNITFAEFDAVDSAFVSELAIWTSSDSFYYNGSSGHRVENGISSVIFTPVATPEPSSLALAALGAGAILKFRRRK